MCITLPLFLNDINLMLRQCAYTNTDASGIHKNIWGMLCWFTIQLLIEGKTENVQEHQWTNCIRREQQNFTPVSQDLLTANSGLFNVAHQTHILVHWNDNINANKDSTVLCMKQIPYHYSGNTMWVIFKWHPF